MEVFTTQEKNCRKEGIIKTKNLQLLYPESYNNIFITNIKTTCLVGKTVLKYSGFNLKNPVTLNLINFIIKFKFSRPIFKIFDYTMLKYVKVFVKCSQRSYSKK